MLDEQTIRQFDAEITAVKACSTYAEAIALAPTLKLKLTQVPGLPDDADELAEEGHEPEDAFDWSETGPVADGDWPPMPTAFGL